MFCLFTLMTEIRGNIPILVRGLENVKSVIYDDGGIIPIVALTPTWLWSAALCSKMYV